MKRAYEDEQGIVDHAADIDDAEVCSYPAGALMAHVPGSVRRHRLHEDRM